MATSRRILDGIRVLDFTSFVAGPYCTMLLADFGAEVIKIEPPEHGDGGRFWGKSTDGRSPVFTATNRNKRSLMLDLQKPDAREIVGRLVARCDVAAEAFSPGVATRLGIGYDDLRALKPDIIYCSVSGFGQTGPLRNKPGFDMALQAHTGIMSMTGEPGAAPVRVGPAAIDILTGSLAFGAINMALYDRKRTGEGQYIDVSLFDSSMSMLSYAVVEYFSAGHIHEPAGSQHPNIVPYGVFKAQDRYFYFGIALEKHWSRFCEKLGLGHIADDPRFATNGSRVNHRKEINDLLTALFSTKPAKEWVELIEATGIPASLIHNVGEASDHPHTAAREAIVDVPDMPGWKMPGIPIKLAHSAGDVRLTPPIAGGNSRELLAEAGYSATDIDKFISTGLVRQAAA
jgi:crotonobetainyl-CoA:carnitine CoA-transferase CaiB-like acyl-CoA transferase